MVDGLILSEWGGEGDRGTVGPFPAGSTVRSSHFLLIMSELESAE